MRNFIIAETVESKIACDLAKAWKSADAAKRDAAIKAVAPQTNYLCFAIKNTRSMFVFYFDGKVETINLPKSVSNPMHLKVDPNRKVVGCCKGRPIYA